MNPRNPDNKPGKRESVPAKPAEKPKGPVTIEHAEEKVNAIKNHVSDKYSKYEDPEEKKKLPRTSEAMKKYKKLKSLIKKITDKIDKLKDQKDKQISKVIKKIHLKLDATMKSEGIKLPEKDSEKPKNTSKKTPKKSEKGPREYSKLNKSQERVLKYQSKYVLYNLRKIEEHGYLRDDIKASLKVQLNKLIGMLGEDPDALSSGLSNHKYFKLPGGYSIALYKWKKNADSKPNAMIYKDNKLISYMVNDEIRSPVGNEKIDATRSYAEMVKCFHLLPQTFYVEDGKMYIKQAKVEDFHKILGDITKYCKKADWKVNIHGCSIAYKNSERKLTIKPENTDFKFSITPPSSQMNVDKGKAGEFVLYETNEQKEQRAKRLKQKEKTKKETREYKTYRKIEIRRGRAKMKSRIDEGKYKKIIETDINKSNPYEFRVKAPDKKAEKLIKTTSIDKLLGLKKCKDVVLVEIRDSEGNLRKGMFYPGQKTCYELKDGKQTTERLKFGKGDTVRLAFAKPNKEHYGMIHPRLKKRIEEPAKPKSKLDDYQNMPSDYKELKEMREKQQKIEQERAKRLKEQKEKNDADYKKMKKLLGGTIKDFNPLKSSPTEFEIKAKSLLKMKMKDFFAGLKDFKDEAVRVTLTDKSGNKRQGVYYPAQKPPAIYKIEDNKQTKKEMKFRRGDKFNVEFFKPTDLDKSIKNPELNEKKS